LSTSDRSSLRKLLAILSYVAAALSGAIGQFCFKVFSTQLGDSAGLDLALSPYLWVAIVAYFGVMALFIVGLRLWGELSTLYPVYGSTFVWAIVIAAVWLDERLTVNGFVGAGLIVVGIALLNLRDRPRGERR
jgi:drug/metabolite transporter (DMT)-like permease